MNKETGSDLDIAFFRDNYIFLAICKQEVEFSSIVIERKKANNFNKPQICQVFFPVKKFSLYVQEIL